MSSVPRQCVILGGGLGSRLGALTAARPKPLLPVGGRPFLHYLLWHARRFGFDRVLLLAGHRAEVLAQEIDALAVDGLAVEVIVEPEPLGTGGAVCAALDRLDETVLLMNGDSLFDFNWLSLGDLVRDAADCDVAMSLRAAPDASRFGVAQLEGARVTAFRERGDAGGGLINGGVYWLRRRGLEGRPPTGSFEHDILPDLAACGRVRGAAKEGFFIDIGVPDSYAAAQTAAPASLRRRAALVAWDQLLKPDFSLEAAGLERVRRANDAGLFVFIHGPAPTEPFAPMEELDRRLRAHGAHVDAYSPRASATEALEDLGLNWPIDPC